VLTLKNEESNNINPLLMMICWIRQELVDSCHVPDLHNLARLGCRGGSTERHD